MQTWAYLRHILDSFVNDNYLGRDFITDLSVSKPFCTGSSVFGASLITTSLRSAELFSPWSTYIGSFVAGTVSSVIDGRFSTVFATRATIFRLTGYIATAPDLCVRSAMFNSSARLRTALTRSSRLLIAELRASFSPMSPASTNIWLRSFTNVGAPLSSLRYSERLQMAQPGSMPIRFKYSALLVARVLRVAPQSRYTIHYYNC